MTLQVGELPSEAMLRILRPAFGRKLHEQARCLGSCRVAPRGWNRLGGMAPICSSMAVRMAVLRAVSCSTTCTGHWSGLLPYRFAKSCAQRG
jgi:hypothetical protein